MYRHRSFLPPLQGAAHSVENAAETPTAVGPLRKRCRHTAAAAAATSAAAASHQQEEPQHLLLSCCIYPNSRARGVYRHLKPPKTQLKITATSRQQQQQQQQQHALLAQYSWTLPVAALREASITKGIETAAAAAAAATAAAAAAASSGCICTGPCSGTVSSLVRKYTGVCLLHF